MQKAIETISRGLTLRGMLHTPDELQGQIPVVCMFHGFTGNRIEAHFLFARLSRRLAKQGIACVRFDFGGSGESDGSFFDMTISGELEDAKAILAYARSLEFADAGRIGVVGLSMGGLVSGMLAGDCRDDIKTLCLWAPARNMRQIYLGRDTANGDFTEITGAKKQEMLARGCKDFSGLPLSVKYLSDLEALDPVGRAAAFDKNVLILHGDCDTVVPVENSRYYLDAYGKRTSFHVVSGADHTFSSAAWTEELFRETELFLNKELF